MQPANDNHAFLARSRETYEFLYQSRKELDRIDTVNNTLMALVARARRELLR